MTHLNSPSGISFENDFPLHYFAKIGDQFRIQTHLKKNSNDLLRRDFYGRSPLHYAVTTGKPYRW